MNPDWTFPIQPDQVNQYVNRGSFHSDFFNNPDALNSTLLDASPIRASEQRTSFPRLGLSGTDSDVISEHAWTSPGIYGDQHDTFGSLSLDDELFPTFFDLGQEETYPNIITEPSTPFPRLPQATEQPHFDSYLLHDPSADGRQGSSTPGNDLSRPVRAFQGSQRKHKAPKERPSRRAKLSAAASNILETHFSNNPYPDYGELSRLNKRTGLGVERIRTWFSNIRHRRAQGHAPVAPSPQELRERLRQSTPISVEGLNQLNRVSPAHSASSLQRYLETPSTEEPILPTATQSFSQVLAARRASDTELEAVILANMERLGKLFPPDLDHSESLQSTLARQDEMLLQSAQQELHLSARRIKKAGSRAGSESSRGSGKSQTSWTSQNSNRSRGSRRGRKNWVRASSVHTPNTPPQMEDTDPVTAESSKLPWYCTSLGCDKAFGFRSQWDRHEAAVHHWPYHWVCNLGEENSTVHRNARSRVFYREDQLLAHMRRAHPGTHISPATATQLKIDNPGFDAESLVCGFCSQTLPNWEERQSHVFAHLEGGALKSQLSYVNNAMSQSWKRWDNWL